MAITLIKLKNGTEVVGCLKKVNNSVVELEEPMQINYKTSEALGLPVVSFTKYCPFSTETIFQFDKEFVLHVTPTKKAVEDYYAHALDFYKNVSEKHLEKELLQAAKLDKNVENMDNENMKNYLRKVKIDGYAQ